jgi:dCTP deaminase
MILSYYRLCELIEQGVINAPMSSVRGTSIDIHLHHEIRREQMGGSLDKVWLSCGDVIKTDLIDMNEYGPYAMQPHEFVLGGSVEVLKMPDNLTGELRLRSSVGRCALNHILSVWVDPWFQGNLTLELKNDTRFKKLVIEPGLLIGQMLFHEHEPVPYDKGYAANGRYMGQSGVTESKGIAVI